MSQKASRLLFINIFISSTRLYVFACIFVFIINIIVIIVFALSDRYDYYELDY